MTPMPEAFEFDLKSFLATAQKFIKDNPGATNPMLMNYMGDWQHSQNKIIIDKLLQVIREYQERLNSARGWVVTHSMQTYSRVAAKEVEQIDELLESTDKILKEIGIEL